MAFVNYRDVLSTVFRVAAAELTYHYRAPSTNNVNTKSVSHSHNRNPGNAGNAGSTSGGMVPVAVRSLVEAIRSEIGLFVCEVCL